MWKKITPNHSLVCWRTSMHSNGLFCQSLHTSFTRNERRTQSIRSRLYHIHVFFPLLYTTSYRNWTERRGRQLLHSNLQSSFFFLFIVLQSVAWFYNVRVSYHRTFSILLLQTSFAFVKTWRKHHITFWLNLRFFLYRKRFSSFGLSHNKLSYNRQKL
jgi:hypothetical protein